MQDFSSLPLKADHAQRPLWVCPDGAVFLEASSSLYAVALRLFSTRRAGGATEHVHQYKLTPHSLYAAAPSASRPLCCC